MEMRIRFILIALLAWGLSGCMPQRKPIPDIKTAEFDGLPSALVELNRYVKKSHHTVNAYNLLVSPDQQIEFPVVSLSKSGMEVKFRKMVSDKAEPNLTASIGWKELDKLELMRVDLIGKECTQFNSVCFSENVSISFCVDRFPPGKNDAYLFYGVLKYVATKAQELPEKPTTLTALAGPIERERAALAEAEPVPVNALRKEKHIVAVFGIEVEGAWLEKAAVDRLSEYLSTSLAASGAYQVIPQDQLRERLLDQKKESYKHCFDQACQIEIGRELAAQKSLSTKIMKIGKICRITTVMYDLKKSASEGGAKGKGGCGEEEIVETIDSIVSQLAAKP